MTVVPTPNPPQDEATAAAIAATTSQLQSRIAEVIGRDGDLSAEIQANPTLLAGFARRFAKAMFDRDSQSMSFILGDAGEHAMSATAVIDILIDCEKTGADASVMVDQALANAASSGKARATAKHVKGSSTPKAKPLPRKHVDSAIGTLLNSNFADQLRSALPAEVADGESGEVEVKIPASMGRDLLAALEELFKAKAAQESPEDNAETETKE